MCSTTHAIIYTLINQESFISAFGAVKYCSWVVWKAVVCTFFVVLPTQKCAAPKPYDLLWYWDMFEPIINNGDVLAGHSIPFARMLVQWFPSSHIWAPTRKPRTSDTNITSSGLYFWEVVNTTTTQVPASYALCQLNNILMRSRRVCLQHAENIPEAELHREEKNKNRKISTFLCLLKCYINMRA